MARPSKLRPEIAEKIIDAILHGGTYKDASEAAGVDYGTFNNWMQQGEEEKSGKFFQFFKSVRLAEAACRLKFTRVIQEAAASGDWRAAEAYLKRRDRANWGDNVDVTTGNEPMTFLVIKATDDTKDNSDQ